MPILMHVAETGHGPRQVLVLVEMRFLRNIEGRP
jgi:hypothetical protein